MRPHQLVDGLWPRLKRLSLAFVTLLLEQAALLGERLFGFGRLMVRSEGVDAIHPRLVKQSTVVRDATGERGDADGHVTVLLVGRRANLRKHAAACKQFARPPSP